MATYAKESNLEQFATMTPEEDEYVNRVERMSGHIAELEKAITGEKRPDVKALLVAERAKLGAAPVASSSSSSSTVTPTKTSSSERVSWKEPGMSQGEAKAMLATLNGQQATAMAALQAAISGSGTASEAIQEGEKKLGASKGAAIDAAGQIDVARAMQQSAIRDVFHASVIDPDSRIVSAQRQRDEAQQMMNDLRGKINEESQVAVWDDPLRWVVNQFTLPKLGAAYNAAHAKDKEMVRQIADTQARVTAQMQMDAAPVLDQIRAKAAADANTAAIEASINASKAAGAQQHIVAQGVMQQMQVHERAFGNNMELARLFMQSYSLGASDRENSKLGPTVDAINVKRLAAGLKHYTVEEFNQLSAAERSKLTENSKITGSFAADAGESYKWLTDNGALNTIAEKNPTVYTFYSQQILGKDYTDALAVVSQNPKFMNLGPDEKRAAALTLSQQNQTSAIGKKNNSNNLLPDSNPYKLKILNAVTYPELKDNIFTSIVADIAATKPGGKVEDKDVMLRLLAKAEADPKNTAVYARQLSDFYRTAAQLQWERSGAKVVGYPAPVGYGVSGVMTEATGVATQMWTPAAVEHWVMKNMQERRRVGFGGATVHLLTPEQIKGINSGE